MIRFLRNNVIFVALLFCAHPSCAQKGVSTFGLQYKPILPNRLIGTYKQDFNETQLVSSVQQKLGHSFGGVVRRGLTKNISFETGINFTQRNFKLDFSVPDSSYQSVSDVGLVSYEIPFSCLVYIQLSDKLFINTSLGTGLTIFTSNVRKQVPIEGANESFLMEGAYKSKIQGVLLANFGFEFRTRKSGYFYLGSSFHLPFAPIITMAMAYEYAGGNAVSRQNVLGSYLTIDLRYFFHEKPEGSSEN